MGIMLALTLHNLPEGLGTFFDGSNGGLTIVIGIGLHNIPEGAAVAIPMYQSTKSYPRTALSVLIASLAQPLGAAIGWCLIYVFGLAGDLPAFFYGAVYALTAGVMVGISIFSLIPEAMENVSSK